MNYTYTLNNVNYNTELNARLASMYGVEVISPVSANLI